MENESRVAMLPAEAASLLSASEPRNLLCDGMMHKEEFGG